MHLGELHGMRRGGFYKTFSITIATRIVIERDLSELNGNVKFAMDMV